MRRCWRVVVCFSLTPDLGCALARCTISMSVAKSTFRQRKALISPRRRPLTIMSHRRDPQSESPQAAPMTTAAPRRWAGSGSVWLADGAIASVAGYAEVTPSDGLLQRGADDVMNPSNGATTERSALMTRIHRMVPERAFAAQGRGAQAETRVS
jgi:hypothetical protein